MSDGGARIAIASFGARLEAGNGSTPADMTELLGELEVTLDPGVSPRLRRLLGIAERAHLRIMGEIGR